MMRKRKIELTLYFFVRLILMFSIRNDFLVLLRKVSNSEQMSFVFVAAFCPLQCDCDDKKLEVRCEKSNLDVIPHTLNPNLRKLLLIDNQIRRIRRSSFTVYQNLETLDLSGNNLTAIEDNAFLGQHRLKVLKLERNAIAALTNQTLSGLHSLETLEINDNFINNISDAVFKHLSKLETLDLTRNEISFIEANAFEGLSKLRNLYLRDNRLGNEASDRTINASDGSSIQVLSLPALSPRLLPNLVRLDLSLNHLNGIAKSSSPFWSRVDGSTVEDRANARQRRSTPILWHHLEELYLDGCFLHFIEPGALNALSSLKILKIQANNFEEVPKDSLNDVSSLHVLYIGQNPFEKINSKAFGSLRNLKSLDISRCSTLTRIDPFAFVNIENLERLELSHNPNLKFLEPEMFDFLPNLRYLSLRGNALSTLDPKFSPIASQVDILDIRDNPFTCNCSVQWLRKLLIGYQNKSSKAEVGLSTEPSVQMQKNRSKINFERLLPAALRQLPPNKSSDSHSSQSALNLPTIKLYTSRVLNVKCANPPPLRDKLLIDLNADDIGCFEVESMAPIVIAVIIAFLILFGVIIICCITCRTRLTVLIKGTSGKSHYPSKFVEPVNNNRKVFGFSNRRINDLDYQYSRPDCIVVRNTGNYESSAMNNLSNPYEITPVPGIRESIYASLDEGMPCVLKTTPTTDL